MVNISADDADTMVDYQRIVLPEQGQQMRKHTPRPQPPAPAPRLKSLEPCSGLRTPETHPLGGPEFQGLVTPQTPRPAAPTLRDAEAAGNSSVVDVDHQLFSDSAGGDSLPDVPLTNVPISEARLDGIIGAE